MWDKPSTDGVEYAAGQYSIGAEERGSRLQAGAATWTRRPLKRPSLIAGSAAAQEALERLVARGPPGGSGISAEAWRSWHRSGFIVCPASKRPHACSNHRRRMGADCRELRALGFACKTGRSGGLAPVESLPALMC